MKTRNALTLMILALATLLASCSVATNLDVREAAFPSEQQLSVTYLSVRYISNNTLTLPDTSTDVGASQSLTMKNSSSSSSIIVQSITLSDAEHFKLAAPSSFPVSISALDSSEIRVYLNTTSAATYTTAMTIAYTIDGRSQTYVLTLQGTRKSNSGIPIALYDENDAAIDDHYAFDLGYKSSGSIVRTLTIKNSGSSGIIIYSVTSNSSAITVSSAPSSGTSLAAGATTTIDLTMSSPATTATATIAITTDYSEDKEFDLSVYGGNSAINVTPSGTFDYRISAYKGYDFGYASGATTKSIILTNSGTAPISLEPSNLTLTAVTSTGFNIAGVSSTTINPGSTANLNITYTPPSTTTWSEAYCVLTDNYGRTYKLYLTGSGFAQPGNISASPAVWLRSDRISISNIVESNKVDVWPDQSGNGMNAEPVYLNTPTTTYLRPAYNSNGINGFPSLTFTGAGTISEAMRIAPAHGPILTSSTGTTTFIAFKIAPSLSYAAENILYPYWGNTVQSYPRLFWDTMYYDSTDGSYYNSPAAGTPAFQKRFAVSGYFLPYAPSYNITTNNSVTVRYPTTATTPTGSSARPVAPTPNTTYAISMLYDETATVSVTDTASNIKMSINGIPTNLRYWHTVSSTAAVTTNGAYGQPVSTNGTGTVATPGAGTATDFITTSAVATPSSGYAGLAYNILFNGTSAINYNKTITSLYIGSDYVPTAGSAFQGEIAEIIMYATPLSDTDIATINAYLVNKYGASTSF